MNLSMKWLSDFVDLGNRTTKDFVNGMTLSGSKVECYEVEGADITNVVVGKILEKNQHENAERLFVCSVDIGKDEPIQIVTNAKNVQVGDLVPVALDGATVFDEGKPLKIKKGKVRGVVSVGMFCGLDTLKLTTHDFPYADKEGVLVIKEDCQVGDDIHSALGLNDTSVEFEITSNRPDCLSVIGLARETSATFDIPFNVPEPTFKGVDGNITDDLKVSVINKDICKRYCAGIVKNVKIEPSPRWLRERLRASGIRPINNFVDITNYVMLEYGQPMHAFDFKYVEGGEINIRNAQDGEKIVTLDGVERTLTSSMLVIADSKKPIAVAGVMGGEYSGIMDGTVTDLPLTETVVFESAVFDPISVRRTAKALGMRTDSSARFEKGLDQQATIKALKRAFQLVEELGAGEVVSTTIDIDNTDKTPNTVEFSSEWINNFLGTDISECDMIKYLNSLGFEVKDGLVYAPTFRVDIERPCDIAEEVARIYGYNNIKSTNFKGVADAQLTASQKFENSIANTMVSTGCYEIATFSFISPKYFDKIHLPQDSKLRNTVTITNPLGEDTSVMRTTIVPSMMEILSKNYNNRNASAKLFEVGNEYIPTEKDKLPIEPKRLAIGMYGNGCDFFELKGTVEVLLDTIGIKDIEYSRPTEDCPFDEVSAFHPTRTAIVKSGDVAIGIIGEIHPSVSAEYGIDTKVYVGKFLVPEMMELAITEKNYKPLPKYPASTRDISLVCDKSLPAGDIQKAIIDAVGKTLETVTLFDIFTDETKIGEGKKSLSYSIVMRSAEGTLTDEQVEASMKRVLKSLSKIGAELRM